MIFLITSVFFLVVALVIVIWSAAIQLHHQTTTDDQFASPRAIKLLFWSAPAILISVILTLFADSAGF